MSEARFFCQRLELGPTKETTRTQHRRALSLFNGRWVSLRTHLLHPEQIEKKGGGGWSGRQLGHVVGDAQQPPLDFHFFLASQPEPPEAPVVF